MYDKGSNEKVNVNILGFYLFKYEALLIYLI